MDTPPDEHLTTRRRSALSEVSLTTYTDNDDDSPSVTQTINSLPSNTVTPTSSPDEQIIQRRGRRQKPITWSPVDLVKTGSSPRKDRTPYKTPPYELRRSLRKRLVLSPGKNPARTLFLDSQPNKIKP